MSCIKSGHPCLHLHICPLCYRWWEWLAEACDRSYTGLGDSCGNVVSMLCRFCANFLGIPIHILDLIPLNSLWHSCSTLVGGRHRGCGIKYNSPWDVVIVLWKCCAKFCAYSVLTLCKSLSPFYSFREPIPPLTVPLALRHALLELDRVTGQLRGCGGGDVVRMLLE